MAEYKDSSQTLSGPYEDNFVGLDQLGVSNQEVAKAERLKQVRDKKLSALASQKPYASLDNSFTTTEDGLLESNANKVWNDLSDQEFRSVFQYGLDSYSLSSNEKGQLLLPNGEEYKGDTRRLYMFGTKDLTDDEIKLGLAKGSLEGSEGRYTQNPETGYGWPSGEEGVDTSKKELDILLPHNVATMLEGLAHGRKSILQNRSVKDRYDDSDLAYKYGSGSSEYYSSREGLFGAPTEYAESVGKNVFDTYYKDAQKRNLRKGVGDVDLAADAIYEDLLRKEAENMDLFDRGTNAAAAFGRTFAREGFVDFADWVGEGLNSVTGGAIGWDVGTEEEKTSMVNDWVGFNPYAAEKEMQEAQTLAASIVDSIFDEDKEVDFGEVARLVRLGITTPELLGDSVGFLASFYIPILGVGGKAVKAENIISEANAAVKAGLKTKEAAKVEIAAAKANVTLLDKVQKFTQKNAGLMQVSAGNVNDQIDAYKEEHGAAPSMYKITQMFATESLLLGLDRWADLSILKSPAALKGAREAFSAITPNEKVKVLTKVVGVAGGLAANMGKEAAQEYVQEIGQEFNVKFNFDENGGFLSATAMDEAATVLLSKEMQTTGVLGAGLGAGGAVQFQAVGSIVPAGKSIVNALSNGTQSLQQNSPAVNEVPATEDEVTTAKKEYGALLTRLRNDVDGGKVTSDNILSYVEDIEKLNETKYVLKDSSVESVEKGEEAYNAIIDKLEKFIVDNADVKLTKRITRKTVQDSITDNRALEALQALPDEAKSAFQTTAEALGEGEEYTFEDSVGIVQKFVGKGTYDEVVEDEEAMGPFIQGLEQSLLGTTSETAEESFAKVQDALSKFSTTQTLPEVDTDQKIPTTETAAPKQGTDTVMGTGPTFTIEEGEYDDFSRTADVTRAISVVLGARGDKISPAVSASMVKFARTQGVDEATLNNLIKSYQSVDEEAISGNRGYSTRVARIKGMLASSNPDKALLKKEYSELTRMVGSIETSADKLRTGIKAMEAKAALLNKNNSPNGGGRNKTEYMTINPKTGKLDVPFTIDIVRNKEGKWEANTTVAKKNLAKKEGYLSDIKKEQLIIGRRANSVAPNIVEVIGTVQIPTAIGTRKKAREADASYLANITKALQTISSKFSFPNKVVLGEATTEKWKVGQDYRKLNALNINSDEFESDDVVLLNDLEVFKAGKDKKGDNFYVPSIASSKEDSELTPEQRSFKAAVAAGAVIVLDRDLLNNEAGPRGKKARKARDAFRSYLTQQGYEFLEKQGTMAFVKPTPETASKIQALKDGAVEENRVRKEKESDKTRLVSLHRAIQTNVDLLDGSDLTDERRAELQEEYDELYFKVKEESFKDSKENLDTYLERAYVDEISKLGTQTLNDPSPVPLNLKDKALQRAVETFINTEVDSDAKGKEVLDAWKQATAVEQQTGKKLESTISSLVKSLGSIPKVLVEKLLSSDKSFAVDKKDIYERVYQRVGKEGQIDVKVTRGEITDKLRKQFEDKKVVVIDGKNYIPITMRRVTQDATKLVQLTRTTVLNSVPIESLPFSLRDISEKFSKDVFKALAKVGEAELAAQTDTRKADGKFVNDGFFLHNSPARGIIFNKDGEANPEVMAAMYLAIGDLLKTDSRNLLLGFKSDVDIANMFNVQEHEVTAEMRDIARSNGAFVKTVASKLGSSIFQQLGLSRKTGDDIAANEYEALVADMGNSAIAIAEIQGILSTSTVDSNKIAKAYKGGEQREVETATRFVNIKSEGKKDGKYTNQVPVEAVDQFNKGFEEVIEGFPEAVTGRKEVLFSAPTEERIEAATSTVRNDIIGLHVPENAKETIEHLMNTPYEYDVVRVDSFLEAVDATGSKVLELLGYVDLESDKYNNMYFKDKDVQEAKNRAIEKSVEEIRTLKKVMESRGEADPSLFFDYSYVGNNRYMLDSNTINPQTDKLHRFLFLPKGASLSYDISESSMLFTATDSDGNVTDESYSLRYSIAQALGMGVDKKKAVNIIEFADVMLGLSQEHIKDIKEKILATGEYKFSHNNKPYEIEAEHISHALHALDTLDKIKEATKPGGTRNIQSTLISEVDSLTNGFANKLQQMPILADMDQHFARVGILTKDFLDQLEDDTRYKAPGEGFNPAEGDSVADLLEEGHKIGFRDSYQNLAGKAIAALVDGTLALANLSHAAKGQKGISGIDIFESVKVLMPGGGSLIKKSAAETIEKDIRELFKNPFMIFNYSASINRITKNLGVSVANTLAKELATSDFSDPEQLHKKQSAEDFLKSVYIIDPADSKKRVTTTARLQEVLKEKSLNEIKIKAMAITSQADSNSREERNLEGALSAVVENTFGVAVKEVFEKEFEPFIKVQTAMNNSFKVAFRIFDSKRMEKLKAIRNEKNGEPLTKADHTKVLEELWNDFPWILGPLTGAENRSDIKDVIAVISTSTKAPNEIEMARKSPQTQLGSGLKGGTRTVNPLVKYLEEAVSAGSVLPFHAIDGAEMSSMINDLSMRAITAIHDAIMVPNSKLDLASFIYQKSMVAINQDNEKGYVLADAMAGLADRIEATVNGENFNTDYKDVTSLGLKGIKKNVRFTDAASTVLSSLREQIQVIKDAREEWYGPGGKMEGAISGNLISTGGGMYRKGDAAPDTSYKKALEKLYTKQNVEFVKPSDVSLDDVFEGLTNPQKKEIVKVVRGLGVEVEKVNDLVASILGLGDKQPVIDALTTRSNSVKSQNNAEQLSLFAESIEDSTNEIDPVEATGISVETKESAEVGKEAVKNTKDCS